MRNRIDIDEMSSRAIIREIGERLQASLSDGAELPDSLRRQIDRLRELDEEAPSTIPDLPSDEIGKPTAPRRLLSPMRWTTRWRTLADEGALSNKGRVWRKPALVSSPTVRPRIPKTRLKSVGGNVGSAPLTRTPRHAVILMPSWTLSARGGQSAIREIRR
jgi:hypothetical protein